MTPTAARQLLVNADDFGWSRSVNAGIVEAHERGIVTSTSLLAAGRDFSDAVILAAATPSLSVGVHLNIFRGTPVLPAEKVSSLLGADGTFPGDWRETMRRVASRRLDLSQVEAEFSAAIEKVKSAGIAPSHVDSEKHLHMWPSVFEVVCRVAARHGVPRVRVVREAFTTRPIPAVLSTLGAIDAGIARRYGLAFADATIGVTDYPLDISALRGLLGRPTAKRVEFVCHPGRVDAEFLEIQRSVANHLVESREMELATLTDKAARQLVARAGFDLCPRFDAPSARASHEAPAA